MDSFWELVVAGMSFYTMTVLASEFLPMKTLFLIQASSPCPCPVESVVELWGRGLECMLTNWCSLEDLHYLKKLCAYVILKFGQYF